MLRRSRYRRERILLPGESEGRRNFLRWGLAGTAILAVGGASWLFTRRTRPMSLGGPLLALSPVEATVVLALSERLLPPHGSFPRPLDVDLPRRVDAIVAMAPEATQAEIRQLVRLFDNALASFLLDGQFHTFTESTLEQQDARIAAWQASRHAIRRTGYKALKRLVYAGYYGAKETWAAIGYPGPPPFTSPERKVEPQPQKPPEPKRPPPRARPPEAAPAPRPVEEAPAPRSGMDLPAEGPP